MKMIEFEKRFHSASAFSLADCAIMLGEEEGRGGKRFRGAPSVKAGGVIGLSGPFEPVAEGANHADLSPLVALLSVAQERVSKSGEVAGTADGGSRPRHGVPRNAVLSSAGGTVGDGLE